MSAPDNINDALNIYKESINTDPLLSESDIKELIQKNPVTEFSAKKPWTPRINPILAIGLVTAAVAVAVFWPTPAPETTIDSHSLANDVEENNVLASNPPSSTASTSKADVASASKAIPSVESIQLNADELSKLGIKLAADKMVYVDPGLRITIGTNGIAVKRTAEQPSAYSPRHISLYHDGKIFASWFDANNEIKVNELVAVRVHLDDAGSTMFPSADVILWYEPTSEFMNRLPGSDRVVTNETSLGFVGNLITSSMVFPNPVSGNSTTIRFEASHELKTSAQLVDVSGRHIRTLWTSVNMVSGNNEQSILDLDTLPNGMYLIVVLVEGTQERIIQRLLIER